MKIKSLVKTSSLFSNLSYKLVSLLVALSIWVSFAGKGRQILVMSVPVSYSLGDSFTFRKPPPESVQLKLSGPKISLNRVRRSNEALLFSLEKASVGENEISISKEDFSLPPGVKLIEVSPDKLYLEIIKKSTAPAAKSKE